MIPQGVFLKKDFGALAPSPDDTKKQEKKANTSQTRGGTKNKK